MIVGHIGARAGSQGLPGKNKKILHGKPLFQWSLDLLRDSSDIDAICVSSDDPEIYEYAIEHGCLDIGLRSSDLASPEASKWIVWQDSLKKIMDLVDEPLDAFCRSRLHQSFTNVADISEALKLFFLNEPDMVMSCCNARKSVL